MAAASCASGRGRPVAAYIPAYEIDLFLSNNDEDVAAAVAHTAAARLALPPQYSSHAGADEVRIALDGDAVVFDDASERIFRENGTEAFIAHERAKADLPLGAGPFGSFLFKLAALRQRALRADGTSRVRVSIVTARHAPAHERVVRTLRAWGAPADEAHFAGGRSKAPILHAFGAHIFFDDYVQHVLTAAPKVPSGLVPCR